MKHLALGLCALCLAAVLVGCEPSPNELLTTGITEYQIGHNEQAKKLFEQNLLKNPTDADSWYYLGRIAYDEKFYERAIYCYQCALDRNPAYEPAKHELQKAKAAAGKVSDYLNIIPVEKPQQ